MRILKDYEKINQQLRQFLRVFKIRNAICTETRIDKRNKTRPLPQTTSFVAP